jgi:hypothetical protein
MHRLMAGSGFLLLSICAAPGIAAAQSWEPGGGTTPDMPPSLIAPAQTPNSATTKVGSTPGVYNQTGELTGSPDTSRYDPAGGPPPVPAASPDAVDAPRDPTGLADPPERH